MLAPALLLSGCDEEQADEVDTSATGGEAAGEVLGGSISDAMIPLEQLRSTSPPAERSGGPGGSATPSDDTEPTTSGPSEIQTEEAEATSEAAALDADQTE
jgi:hypothetical protein